MVKKIAVGDEAPDFVLPDTELKPVQLKKFRGSNVVIAFFVSAFTATCTKEACAFRDITYRLVNLKTQVIGISVNDPFSNKIFAKKNKLVFPILSDYNRAVIKMYGLKSPDYAGLKGYTVAKRSIFIVDKKGIIRYVWIAENAEIKPDYNEIEQTLQKMEKPE